MESITTEGRAMPRNGPSEGSVRSALSIFDIVAEVEEIAVAIAEDTGRRPGHLIVSGEMAERIRGAGFAAEPFLKLRPVEHARPCGVVPPGTRLVAEVAGIEIFELLT